MFSIFIVFVKRVNTQSSDMKQIFDPPTRRYTSISERRDNPTTRTLF